MLDRYRKQNGEWNKMISPLTTRQRIMLTQMILATAALVLGVGGALDAYGLRDVIPSEELYNRYFGNALVALVGSVLLIFPLMGNSIFTLLFTLGGRKQDNLMKVTHFMGEQNDNEVD